MAENFEISDEMRAVIGVESPPWTHEVTTTSVRAFARGVGYTDLVYYDEEAARAVGYRSLPAPPTYLGTPVFIPGKSSDTFSGPKDSGPSVDHGLPNLLDGGTETEYFGDICAGDSLTVTSQVVDLSTREGRSTGTMLISTSETRVVNQDGELVAVQRGQAIFY
ncbi:MAG: MaoC family dehydratase [bacterium]|nr:MaoC family dehydratase [bacterium]